MHPEEFKLLSSYQDNFEADKLITFLDQSNNNVYSSIKYAELFDLTPADLLGKNLIEFTQNKYAMSMVNSTERYLKLMLLVKPLFISGIIKCITPSGVQVFLFEVSRLKNLYYKAEFKQLQINLIKDVLYIINQISRARKYQNKIVTIDNSRNLLAANLKFNEREEVIVFLLAIGKSYKEIANIFTELYKSESSDVQIKRLVHNKLFNKFNVFSLNELINLYLAKSSTYSIPEKLVSLANFNGIMTISYYEDV